MKQQTVRYYNDAIYWFFNGEFHRNVDLPTVYSFRYGKLDIALYCKRYKNHRTAGPALIDYGNKKKHYYYQGRLCKNLEEILMLEVCK